MEVVFVQLWRCIKLLSINWWSTWQLHLIDERKGGACVDKENQRGLTLPKYSGPQQ